MQWWDRQPNGTAQADIGLSLRADRLECAYAACRLIARSTAGNFYYSFLLLPGRQRRSMCALYAFMRLTDDLADGTGSVTDRRAALEKWRAHLNQVLAGEDESEEVWWLALADT